MFQGRSSVSSRPSTPITGRVGSARRMILCMYVSQNSGTSWWSVGVMMRLSLPISHAAMAGWCFSRSTKYFMYRPLHFRQ